MSALLYVVVTLLTSITAAKDSSSLLNRLPLVNNLANAQVPTSEVTYAVATRNSPKLQNFATPIDASKLKKNKPVVFIIHGWTNNGQVPWIQNLTRVLLKRSDCNVISVDWKKPANGSYPSTVPKVRKVGKCLLFKVYFALTTFFVVGEIVGDAIVTLVQKEKIPLKNFHVIGHSLGAHVVAFAAQRVKSKLRKPLPWITGLDPAGPLYETPVKVPKNQRLSDDDATVVEVVHTDGGLLGFHSSIGTIDFYPNGGLFIQPNCTSSTSSKKLENFGKARFEVISTRF